VTLKIYTKDNSKVGSNMFFVKATYFNVNLPYYVESPHFMIEILHQCYRNVISSSQFTETTYLISSPELILQSDQWKLSDPFCKPITFHVSLVSGDPLPTFITFNPMKMSFRVFTKLPKFAKTYLIKIHGTTIYFNQTESTNVVMA
jgi:hypothetical protein